MAFGLSGHAGRSQMVTFIFEFTRVTFFQTLRFIFSFIERLAPMLWSLIMIECQKCSEPTIISFHIWLNAMAPKALVPTNGWAVRMMSLCVSNPLCSPFFVSYLLKCVCVLSVTADRKNGVTNVKYKRPLQTNDSNLDRPIEASNDLSVIAAIGPLNSKGEANAHSHDGLGINYEDMKIDFSSRVRT